ncbi:MFS transporter [Primorskyibacter sp. S87]|uniref:MFS transporter n=1 Tax=Primorskyibacter sp. S87 TaxID=3415126 RepID=UPI003C7D79C6
MAAFVIVFLTNAKAAARIKTAPASDEGEASAARVSVSSLLISRFGVLLIAIFLVSTGHGVITGQFPNYLDKVFSVAAEQSTLVLSISAVVTLLTLDLIGRWMGKSGPAPVWLTAVGMKSMMMLALSVLAFAAGGLVISFLPLGIYLVFMQGIAWADMTQPALASRASTAGAGLTQGLLMFAMAMAFGVGGFLGGTFADSFGFQSLAWLTAAVSIGALVLGFLSVPRKNQAEVS